MHLLAIFLLAVATLFFLLGGWRLVAWVFVIGVFTFAFLLYSESRREMTGYTLDPPPGFVPITPSNRPH
jgi:hypothetical protein